MPASSRSALGRPLVRMQSIITAAELTAAGTAQSLSLGTIPTDAVIEEVWHETPTLLADAGSISAVTMQVGTSGAAAYLIAATSVFTGGTQTRQSGAGTGARVLPAATEMLAKFTATGANFGTGSATSLDAGTVIITILYRVV